MTSLFAAVGRCREGSPTATFPGESGTSFVFPPEFLGFAGHFPENPVLPGIAQVMAVQHALGSETPPDLCGIKICKFLRPVRPGERLTVTLQMGDGAAAPVVSAVLAVAGEVCATMTLVLSAPDTELYAKPDIKKEGDIK